MCNTLRQTKGREKYKKCENTASLPPSKQNNEVIVAPSSSKNTIENQESERETFTPELPYKDVLLTKRSKNDEDDNPIKTKSKGRRTSHKDYHHNHRGKSRSTERSVSRERHNKSRSRHY